MTALQTDDSVKNIINATNKYSEYINAYNSDISDRITYGSPPDAVVAANMEQFDKDFRTSNNLNLSLALAGIHRLLVTNKSTSALVKCTDADLVALQAKATHPFDDRSAYNQAHDLLDYVRGLEAKGTAILQDLNARQALKSLTDSTNAAYPGSPAIPLAQVPQQALCGEIKSQVAALGSNTPPEKLRWLDAIKYCRAAETTINDTYKRLVQQIEYTGAPYTDENVVLSMGNTIFPYGTSDRSWLWLRPDKFSLSEVSYPHRQTTGNGILPTPSGDGMIFSGLPVQQDRNGNYSSTQFANAGNASDYYSGDANMRFDGIWHGASQAWIDLYSAYDEYLMKKGSKGDMISMMAEAKGVPIPTEPDHLFPNISATPYWMTGIDYTLEWNRLVGDDRTGDKTYNVHCFVAAGINPTWYYSSGGSKNKKETLNTTGKVCSSEEFAGMSRLYTPDPWDSYTNGYSRWWGYKDEHYKPYESVLGGYYKKFMQESKRSQELNYLGGRELRPAVYFFDTSSYYRERATLPHYPVLDVSKRACWDSIVQKKVANDDPLPTTRSNTLFRDSGTVNLPTRCGKDMDRFISQRVPRPPSVLAEDLRKDPPPPDVAQP